MGGDQQRKSLQAEAGPDCRPSASTWRKNPEIMAARQFAKQFGRHAVVVLSFDREGWHVATYGAGRSLCDAADAVGDQIGSLVARGFIATDCIADALRGQPVVPRCP